MDIKSILLPEQERLTRKAEELRRRGYSEEEIVEAMGLSPVRAARLFGPPRKPSVAPPSGGKRAK